MTPRLPLVCFTGLLLILSACSSEPAAPSAPAGPPPAADSLTGVWSGTWGPNERDRNDVTLELKWDGSALSGTVNPTTQAIPVKNASYAADTGTIKMEADAPGRGGTTVHFTIEGKVEGTSMSGSWSHDNNKGDFKITKN